MDDAVRNIVREENDRLYERLSSLLISQKTEGEFLTITNAAKAAKCSVGTIRNWIKSSVLTAAKRGRIVRISKVDLDRLLASSEKKEVTTEAKNIANQMIKNRRVV